MSKIAPTYTKTQMNVQCMWTLKVKVLQKGCQDSETNSYVHTKQTTEGEEKTKQKNHRQLQTLQLFYREISLKTLSICQCFFILTEYVADLAYPELQEALDNIPYQEFLK